MTYNFVISFFLFTFAHQMQKPMNALLDVPVDNTVDVLEKYRLFDIPIIYVLQVLLLLLLIVCVVTIVLLLVRQKALREARQTIEANNDALRVANEIKENVVGSFLAQISNYLKDVQQYQDDVKDHVVHRRLNELMTVPKNADARQQRKRLDKGIDELTLYLFPTFIEDFNALMPKDEPMEIKKDELLNPPMRIFALIRLGITHNEVIAEILDYSINTVYTYKTRIINRSGMKPEQFYEALMKISSIPR